MQTIILRCCCFFLPHHYFFLSFEKNLFFFICVAFSFANEAWIRLPHFIVAHFFSSVCVYSLPGFISLLFPIPLLSLCYKRTFRQFLASIVWPNGAAPSSPACWLPKHNPYYRFGHRIRRWLYTNSAVCSERACCNNLYIFALLWEWRFFVLVLISSSLDHLI